MLLNTEAEAARVTEVPPQKLILLNFQATLKKLHSLLAPHRHVASNLLITPDPERSNRVASFRKDRTLAAQLLQNLNPKKKLKMKITMNNKKTPLLYIRASESF